MLPCFEQICHVICGFLVWFLGFIFFFLLIVLLSNRYVNMLDLSWLLGNVFYVYGSHGFARSEKVFQTKQSNSIQSKKIFIIASIKQLVKEEELGRKKTLYHNDKTCS